MTITHPDVLDDITRRLAAKLQPAGDCLEFTGARNSDGYGTIRLGDRMVKAHRLTYELIHGPIPDGLLVCHRCDNPPCCNVDHLFLGTVADNNRDRHQKGRTKNLELGTAALVARAAAVTHCPHGHPYAGDNLVLLPTGARRCRECHRARGRVWRAKQTGASHA